jgi:16S rRNA processing protein RimM
MMNFDLTHHVQVAKVTKAHGIKGEIKIYPFSGNPESFALYKSLVLVDAKQNVAREIELVKSRTQGNVAVLTLAEITSRNDAEQLVDCEIWVSRDELPDLEEDEYYWNDFEGMEVFTREGMHLGRVSNLMATGAHDILIVSGGGGEYMIPVRDEFLVEYSVGEKRIVVDPPEGLLEINKREK